MSVFAGTRKLIWVGDTYSSGAVLPLIITEAPASWVGSCPLPSSWAVAVLFDRPVPNREAREFGATAGW